MELFCRLSVVTVYFKFSLVREFAFELVWKSKSCLKTTAQPQKGQIEVYFKGRQTSMWPLQDVVFLENTSTIIIMK